MGSNDESAFEIRPGTFNANSVRLVFEVIGSVDLNDRIVAEIGCGRGGNSALVAEKFKAQVTGIDMSAEAIAFCSKTHLGDSIEFKVGDALNIPWPMDRATPSSMWSHHIHMEPSKIPEGSSPDLPPRSMVFAYRLSES